MTAGRGELRRCQGDIAPVHAGHAPAGVKRQPARVDRAASNGDLEAWKLINGVWYGPLVGTVVTGQTYAIDRTLVVTAAGTSLTVKVNSLARVTWGASDIPSAPARVTMAGLYVDTSGFSSTWPQLDNFSVAAP